MRFGKRDKVPAKESPAINGKGKNAETSPRRTGLMQVAVVLLGAVVAGLLLDGLLLQSVEQEQARAALENRLEAQKRQVEQRLNSLRAMVRNLAREPVVVEALADPGEQAQIQTLLAGLVPLVREVYLFSAGDADQIDAESSGLGFASLDLARDAGADNAIMMDAFRRDERWQFQIAAPVTAAETDQVMGSALAILDDAALAPAMVQPAGQPGRVSLIHRVSGQDVVVLGQGSGSGVTLTTDLSFPGWKLQLEAPVARQASFDRPLFWLVLIGIGILCAGLVFALMHGLGRALQRQAGLLEQWAGKAFTGERASLPELSLVPLAALAESLKRLVELVDRRVARAESASRRLDQQGGDAHSRGAEEPLFQDDGLLGVDMLDSDDDILGLGDSHSAPPPTMDVDTSEATTVDVDIPSSIFRAYDIRGIVGETLTPEIVRYIGLAIGSEAASRGSTSICVGYDGRHSSPELADALSRGLIATGCDVINIGLVPTPVLYFATHHLGTGSGVMITGSHNPANYNGLKMMIDGTTLADEDIQGLLGRIREGRFRQGQGQLSEQDVRQAYLDTIVGDIAVAAPLKVVVDAGNGVAGELGPRLIEELGCEVVPLYCEVDGDFPNHHPDPGKPENLADLIARVQSEKADLGVAFDGDGDRLGVVTNTGKIIWADRLLMLFARDVVSRNPGADIIYDVKCSRRLAATINEFGGRPIMWKTGHSLVKAKMKETGALLAGEMSGHVFFKERWFGFDDGIYSAARLLEILGIEDRTSDEVFADFPEDVSTPELNLTVTDENKFAIIEKLASEGEFGEANINTIDGVRVDYADGWGLCRASNTTPMLVLRFEAESEDSLERIKAIFREQLQRLAPDVDITF